MHADQPEITSMQRCDRDSKQDFATVDVKAVLRALAGVPIQSWSFKGSPGVRHIGPVAQDFAAAFKFGDNERQIDPVDANGVTMASVQALYWMIQERDRQISELWAELDELRAIVRQGEFAPSSSSI